MILIPKAQAALRLERQMTGRLILTPSLRKLLTAADAKMVTVTKIHFWTRSSVVEHRLHRTFNEAIQHKSALLFVFKNQRINL